MRVVALTARVEDYLEAVFEIEISGRLATVTELSQKLGVTKATVTAILKRMKESDLLEHERYGDVALTELGQERAAVIYRRHQFLADFFVNVLGFSTAQARAVSCVMEHEICEHTEARFAAFTDAILQAESDDASWYRELKEKIEMPHALSVPLAMPSKWSAGCVCRLTASGEMRAHLLELGFVTGARVERGHPFMRKDPFLVQVNDREVAVSKKEAAVIWVVPDPAV